MIPSGYSFSLHHLRAKFTNPCYQHWGVADGPTILFTLCWEARYTSTHIGGKYFLSKLPSVKTYLLFLECVDNRALAHIGVTNNADTDLFLVRVELRELGNKHEHTHGRTDSELGGR